MGAMSYLVNGISCSRNSGQNRIISPVDVSLDTPVEAQHCHQHDHQDPEHFPEPGLIGEEDVDQPLRTKKSRRTLTPRKNNSSKNFNNSSKTTAQKIRGHFGDMSPKTARKIRP